MNQRPVWLRRERAYRAYVRGLRYALLGCALAALAGLGSATGVLPTPVVAGSAVAALVIGVPSVLVGCIGWMLVPDKKRATIHDVPLLSMIAHDIVKGLPDGR